MCGIVGFWNIGRSAISTQEFDRFTDSLSHRGPDGRGTHLDKSSGMHFGHRRLAVLDLSATGSQPMSYGDSRYWIVHNGEIYNYKELSNYLSSKGIILKTKSDTEILTEGLEKDGIEFVNKIDGFFAFAFLDKANNKLILNKGEIRCGRAIILIMVCRSRTGGPVW